MCFSSGGLLEVFVDARLLTVSNRMVGLSVILWCRLFFLRLYVYFVTTTTVCEHEIFRRLQVIEALEDAVLLGYCSKIPRIKTRCGKWSLLPSKIFEFRDQKERRDDKNVGNFAKSQLNTWRILFKSRHLS